MISQGLWGYGPGDAGPSALNHLLSDPKLTLIQLLGKGCSLEGRQANLGRFKFWLLLGLLQQAQLRPSQAAEVAGASPESLVLAAAASAGRTSPAGWAEIYYGMLWFGGSCTHNMGPLRYPQLLRRISLKCRGPLDGSRIAERDRGTCTARLAIMRKF